MLVVVMAVQSVLAQDAVLMRRTFKNDSVEQFKVTTEMTVAFKADGEDFKSSSNLTNDRFLRYKVVDDKGDAAFSFEDSNYKGTEEVDGETTKIEDPESYDSAFTAKVNPLMVLTDIKDKAPAKPPSEEEAGESSIDLIFDSFDVGPLVYRLPEAAVKPGDTWKFELPSNNVFKPGQFVNGKFRGREKWNDQDVLVIEYKTTADAVVDLAKFAGSGEEAEMMKNAELTGDLDDFTILYLDPKDFSILGTTEVETAHMHLKADEFEMTYEIKWKEGTMRVVK